MALFRRAVDLLKIGVAAGSVDRRTAVVCSWCRSGLRIAAFLSQQEPARTRRSRSMSPPRGRTAEPPSAGPIAVRC